LVDTLAETPEHLAERAEVRVNIMNHIARQGDVEELATSLFQEGRELAVRCGDARVLSQVLSTFDFGRAVSGAIEEALAPVLESIRLADGTGDKALRVLVRLNLTVAYLFAGRLREGLGVVEQVMALTQGDLGIGAVGTGFNPGLGLLLYRGITLSL